jgi:hypothetical protein
MILGVMNLAVMLLVAAVIAVEKLWTRELPQDSSRRRHWYRRFLSGPGGQVMDLTYNAYKVLLRPELVPIADTIDDPQSIPSLEKDLCR